LTITSRYPPKIFLLMLDIANKNGIPVKRVETVFLQKGFTEMGLLKCDHINMGVRKGDKKPFCKDCWTIFIQLSPPTFDSKGILVKAGQYVREPTFLDDKDKGEDQEVVYLTGPPRKRPRFKTVNAPSAQGDF
jgi:hypothetical protein